MQIDVLVNLRAGRGSEAVARLCAAELPEARVVASHNLDEAAGFARHIVEAPPGLIVSAGGDGTAVGLLNAIRRAAPDETRVPALGLLPLGTGNGWARTSGAPPWRTGVTRLGQVARGTAPVPLVRYDLLEVAGQLAHFAGTGWDAEMIDDYYEQQTGFGLLPRGLRTGLPGYLHGMFTRTIPRHMRGADPVEVELTNTGEDALTVDDSGHPQPLRGGEHGAVLYRGPAKVCAAGTSPEWGFGFRAFPFAGLVARRFCMRVYAGHVAKATMRMGGLWRGVHPMPDMHTWLLTRCHAVFNRPVPFQVGGDRIDHKTEIDYTLAPDQVDILDWRRIAA